MELEIKSRYKLTEFGPIPEDWQVKEFVEVMEGFSSGQTPYRAVAEYYKGDIPWITSGELNYNIITDTYEKISLAGLREARLKIIPKGTFLFAITGLEAAGTRGSCAITGIDATTNQSCMALYPKKGLLTTSYLFHFYVRYGNELAFKYCQGTKQQSYTGGIAKKLPIVVPPTVEEQTAIANVLSNIDNLIGSLETLIAKKGNIKLGAMQKLLHPKEGWEVKKLREVATIVRGASPRPIEDPKWFDDTSSIGWVRISDVTKSVKELTDTTQQLSSLGIRSSRYVAKNNLIMSICATVGRPILTRINVCIHDGFVVFRNPQVDINYLYYYLTFIEKDWSRNGQTGSQMNLNTALINTTKIPIPPTKEEQIEIASSLSDIDAEIVALVTKMEKYKNIKQAMMQNLLTGKIRLV